MKELGYLDYGQACKYLGITRYKLTNLIQAGILTPIALKHKPSDTKDSGGYFTPEQLNTFLYNTAYYKTCIEARAKQELSKS
ncbi:MAG: hypothetical protein LBN97_04705 [Oscillospiraceae bacterium]|jgi:hypothetical protein|nr:hypothetical protein [Oscillospiraceae bacterium]